MVKIVLNCSFHATDGGVNNALIEARNALFTYDNLRTFTLEEGEFDIKFGTIQYRTNSYLNKPVNFREYLKEAILKHSIPFESYNPDNIAYNIF